MNDKALLIFIKNPELGKAKTRIAKTVGDEKALQVYLELLCHTQNISSTISAERYLFYSQFVDETDDWNPDVFHKKVQKGEDLGERMSNAFQQAFEQYGKVIIIGSDCASLNEELIEAAYDILEEKDFVVGPAKDGGYYLLGMTAYHPEVFHDMEWSTDKVLPVTLDRIMQLEASYQLLPTLSDIDHWEDWVSHGWGV